MQQTTRPLLERIELQRESRQCELQPGQFPGAGSFGELVDVLNETEPME